MTIIIRALGLAGREDPGRFVFTEGPIVIGTDPSSDLALVDEKKVVSRRHAKIEFQDGALRLMDLHSRNFTYVNGERLEPGQPYAVQDGDRIRIGEFSLCIAIRRDADSESKKGSGDEDRSTLLKSSVAELGKILQRISRECDRQNPEGRQEGSSQGMRSSLPGSEIDAADTIVSSVIERFDLGGWDDPVRERASAGSVSTKLCEAIVEIRELLRPAEFGKQERNAGADGPSTGGDVRSETGSGETRDGNASAARLNATAARLERVVDSLMSSMIELIRWPWQFRLEFLGHAIIETPHDFPFHMSSVEEIKDFVLDEKASEDESKRRLRALQEAAKEVLLHQIAVLDGYRMSVNEGVRQVLEQFDPTTIEDGLRDGGVRMGPIRIPCRYVPFLTRGRLLQYLRDQHREMMEEDKNVFEKRIFRPSFIRGYLSTMESARQRTTNDEGADE